MRPPAAPVLRCIARAVRARALALAVFASLLVPAVPAAAAPAQEFPQLAPGLWEMDRTSDSMPPQPDAGRTTLCLDRSLSKQMFEMGAGAMSGMCSRHEFHLSGNRASGDFVCEMGGSRMHSKSTMVIDGDRAYRTTIHTTWDPPLMGRAATDTVLTARRLGPCLPGQQPGDMTTAQGHKFNIRDALQGRGGAPR